MECCTIPSTQSSHTSGTLLGIGLPPPTRVEGNPSTAGIALGYQKRPLITYYILSYELWLIDLLSITINLTKCEGLFWEGPAKIIHPIVELVASQCMYF